MNHRKYIEFLNVIENLNATHAIPGHRAADMNQSRSILGDLRF